MSNPRRSTPNDNPGGPYAAAVYQLQQFLSRIAPTQGLPLLTPQLFIDPLYAHYYVPDRPNVAGMVEDTVFLDITDAPGIPVTPHFEGDPTAPPPAAGAGGGGAGGGGAGGATYDHAGWFQVNDIDLGLIFAAANTYPTEPGVYDPPLYHIWQMQYYQPFITPAGGPLAGYAAGDPPVAQGAYGNQMPWDPTTLINDSDRNYPFGLDIQWPCGVNEQPVPYPNGSGQRMLGCHRGNTNFAPYDVTAEAPYRHTWLHCVECMDQVMAETTNADGSPMHPTAIATLCVAAGVDPQFIAAAMVIGDPDQHGGEAPGTSPAPVDEQRFHLRMLLVDRYDEDRLDIVTRAWISQALRWTGHGLLVETAQGQWWHTMHNVPQIYMNVTVPWATGHNIHPDTTQQMWINPHHLIDIHGNPIMQAGAGIAQLPLGWESVFPDFPAPTDPEANPEANPELDPEVQAFLDGIEDLQVTACPTDPPPPPPPGGGHDETRRRLEGCMKYGLVLPRGVQCKYMDANLCNISIQQDSYSRGKYKECIWKNNTCMLGNEVHGSMVDATNPNILCSESARRMNKQRVSTCDSVPIPSANASTFRCDNYFSEQNGLMCCNPHRESHGKCARSVDYIKGSVMQCLDSIPSVMGENINSVNTNCVFRKEDRVSTPTECIGLDWAQCALNQQGSKPLCQWLRPIHRAGSETTYGDGSCRPIMTNSCQDTLSANCDNSGGVDGVIDCAECAAPYAGNPCTHDQISRWCAGV